MRIQVMKMEDYEEVYDLWIHTAGMGLNDKEDAKIGITNYLKRNPTSCFVAKQNNSIIGVIMSGHDGRRGYIYHTTVSTNYRKQGIGKTLVDCALEALKKEGIHKVALLAFKKNEVGNAFWKQYGCTVREDVNYFDMLLTDLKRNDVPYEE